MGSGAWLSLSSPVGTIGPTTVTFGEVLLTGFVNARESNPHRDTGVDEMIGLVSFVGA
jgi:hypothetical protein